MSNRSIVPSVLLLFVLILPIGMVHAGWMKVGGPFKSQDRFEVEMPSGWKLRTPVDDELFLTRDGMWLQFVRVGRSAEEGREARSSCWFLQLLLVC